MNTQNSRPDLNPTTDASGDTARPRSLRLRRFGVAGACAATLMFGMLIWVKLRVVESVPRQAYADPSKQAAEAKGVERTGAGGRAPAGFKPGKAPRTVLEAERQNLPQAGDAPQGWSQDDLPQDGESKGGEAGVDEPSAPSGD